MKREDWQDHIAQCSWRNWDVQARERNDPLQNLEKFLNSARTSSPDLLGSEEPASTLADLLDIVL